MASIKVLSSSDDPAFRASLRAALAGDERLILTDSVWESPARLFAHIRAAGPSVVLIDESCAPPISMVTEMQSTFMPARVIVVVEECGHRKLADLIRYGARGCIQKNALPELWGKAIHAVHDGDIWVNRSVVLELLEALVGIVPATKPIEAAPDGRLTEREWEVARLVARGMTNKEVARFMTISDTTVKTHLKHIFNKLHLTRRAQIPQLARESWPSADVVDSDYKSGRHRR